MSFLISIVPTLIVLGVLILIHELGHFIACRLTGVKVEKFSIGFGPEIFHWQGKETRYVVSLLPLGGFVKPQGESVSEVEETGSRDGDYLSAPLASRILIVVAGVIMNYFLAFVLFTSVFMMGRPIPGTTIGSFVDGYPAKESGLVAGDRVVQVNQTQVKNWNELTEAITTSATPELFLLVDRKSSAQHSELVSVKVQARVEDVKDVFGKEVQVRRLGITPHPEANEFERYAFFPSLQKSAQAVWTLAAMTHKAIFYMITGQIGRAHV